MKNKLHSKVAIGDWLTVNCRLVPQHPDEGKGDDDMVTPEELEATRKLIENSTPVEDNDVDDFDLDPIL